ncbi:DUF11 domain-containing protein [Erythrobacter sp. THAF29]|uniref:DUF11 domain-containing protein n=1 Tax=Erythrobacter sp. THAF29 TaxID=2587851 RepID=UPI0012A87C38|nr:DUF11 domain-containing protein [Erythrobacter sp. THAF29]QFT77598.1 hypothetical protein FIU90_08610 [Erythrobacter sp. THAF29]
MSRSIPRNVNGLFTMMRYVNAMVECGINNTLKRRIFSILAMTFAMITSVAVSAQNADIDWADAGIASLGSLPSGTTATGSDGTVATITWSSQSVAPSTFEPAFSPTFVSYFSGTLGGNVSPLLLSFDNSAYDPNDRVVVTITLSRAVRNLQFSLSDIDTGNFRDAVEVRYDDDLTGSFSNARANSAFWTAGSAVQEANDGTVDGWIGIANASNAQTTGNVNFDFGNTPVQRIQITYFSNTLAGGGDPGTQFSTISDLQFLQRSADLSLSKQLLGSPPREGEFATWQLTVTNDAASETTANGIVVRDTFPASFAFDNASGDGSFDPASGDWTVGTLAPGASATINIAGTISAVAGSTVTNSAEVIASSAPDPDSSVNNGNSLEDDFASSSFTVASDPPGIPPTLTCPAGVSVFDWDAVNWPGGSLSNSYPLASFGTIAFDIVTNGNFVSRASFGGDVPRLTNAVSGGLNPAELALAYNQNNDTRDQEAVTTVTLPQAFTGVQFSVFDIDRSGTFQDRITAYGLLNGVRVNAVLTSGSANTVSGPSLIGISGAGDTTANGTGVITFLDPIDTIVIEYGNGPDAPANPSNQSIAIHDISLCSPALPSISVTKVSSIIADPVSGASNPKAIPGATVQYLITISNTGSGAADADSVVVRDDGPADAKLCLLGRSGGPVIFGDPGSNSGLSYSFTNLASTTDDVEFSNDGGGTFSYVPSADGDGCDSAITDFRVRPGGAFSAGGTFTLTVRYIVN